MTQAFLEHINITVSNPKTTAERLCQLFDWSIRWSGDSICGGESYHVGGENSYLAIYKNSHDLEKPTNTYQTIGGLNHVGVVVEDLDEIELRVKKLGFETHSHGDYEPGRRFYFQDNDKIEIEVISYS